MRIFLYPSAFMSNSFSMMLVMIGLGLFGRPALAADFGIIHGATVALFYSLSGNARSLILGESEAIDAREILCVRGYLILPLCLLAYFLSVGMIDIGGVFVACLIVRRGCEWLAEVFLSVHERQQKALYAFGFTITQTLISLSLIAALVQEAGIADFLLIIWAFSPLFWCLGTNLLHASGSKPAAGFISSMRVLMPHFGSTAVIGVSVYLFRLFIILIVEKEFAGDLFSAFAMGGILGAVFAQALGPTVIHHELNGRGGRIRYLLNLICICAFTAGAMLIMQTVISPQNIAWTQKSAIFWQAVGFSLIGSVVMVLGQRVRLRILQSSSGGDVFGSDVLANIALVLSIPFLYSTLGIDSFVVLYFLGAVLSFLFYLSERKGLIPCGSLIKTNQRLMLLLVSSLFLPIFFQLSRGIYYVYPYTILFNTENRFDLLPFPLSLVTCYIGILWIGCYTKVRLSLTVLFFTFLGLLLSTAIMVQVNSYEYNGLLLFVQYMLPTFGLVLGQQYSNRPGALSVMARAFFWVLYAVVPLQLVSSFIHGGTVLSSSAFLFSVYQHLEYVPVIFVVAFLISVCSLWRQPAYRLYLIALAVLMGLYVALSMALLAILLFISGLIVFGGYLFSRCNDDIKALLLIVCGLVSLTLGVLFLSNNDLVEAEIYAHGNSIDRIGYWRFYSEGLMESWVTGLFGNAKPLDRLLAPSANNYYFDFVYNFGLVAIFPIIWLVYFTLCQVIRHRAAILLNVEVLGLAAAVLFLVIIDSQFKGGMCQPYSGIFTFFLWGSLLAEILKFEKDSSSNKHQKD